MVRFRHASPLLVVPFAGALAMSHPGFAQAPDESVQESVQERYTLSAEASGEVANDLLVARLAVQDEDIDPDALAARINRTMAEALATLEGDTALTVRTLDYRTDPVYDERSRELTLWRAVQALELRTGDIPAGSAAIGRLQASLRVQDVSLQPAPATRRAAEDALTIEALEAFSARAALVADAMGADGHRVVQADVQTQGARGPVYARAAMADSAARASAEAAPALAAGTSELTVRVYGTVALQR